MVKRAVLVGLVGLGLVLIQSGATQAHGIPIGNRWYPGSLISESTFKGISNPEVHPGITIWVATVKEAEYLCFNPAGNQASLQVMERDITITDSASFSDFQSEWTKKQGRLEQTKTLDTGVVATQLGCATGGGGHHNWEPQPDTVVITHFTGLVSAYACLDGEVPCEDREFLGSLQQECYLPNGYGPQNPPDSNVEYDCPTNEAVYFHNK